MRPSHYVLIDDNPVPVDTETTDGLIEWAKWMGYGNGIECDHRVVAKTKMPGVLISSVFLGVDHQFCLDDRLPPILFETMVFPCKDRVPPEFYEKWDGYQERHSTWAEAKRVHEELREQIVAELKRKSLWQRLCHWFQSLYREKP